MNTIFNFQPSNQGSCIKIKQGKKAIDDVGDGPELVGKGRFENLLYARAQPLDLVGKSNIWIERRLLSNGIFDLGLRTRFEVESQREN